MTREPNQLTRRARTKGEILEALQIQLSLLIKYLQAYDNGDTTMSLPASSTLRNLLHTPKRGVALLAQANLLEGDWYDTAFPIPVVQEIDTCTLVNWMFGPGGAKALPSFVQDRIPSKIPFNNWWTDPVAHSQAHGSYSRRDFVLAMADTEGSHVDPSLPDSYWALRDGSFISNLKMVSGDRQEHVPGINHACIRAIAHELLLTVHRHKREALLERYIWPTTSGAMATKLTGE